MDSVGVFPLSPSLRCVCVQTLIIEEENMDTRERVCEDHGMDELESGERRMEEKAEENHSKH